MTGMLMKGAGIYLGQRVMAKNMRPGPAWVPGRIVAQNGPLSYEILTDDSQVWKRHVEHLKVLDETVEMQPSHAEAGTFDFDKINITARSIYRRGSTHFSSCYS